MPIFIIILTLLLATVCSFYLGKNIRRLEKIVIFSAIIELITAGYVFFSFITWGQINFEPLFSLNAIGVLFFCLIALIGSTASLYSIGYLRVEMAKGIITVSQIRIFYILTHLFLLAMFVAISANNPVLAWIAIEATTLSTAFLICFYKKPTAIEAAWKYLIVNSVGLLLGFLGTMLFVALALKGVGTNAWLSWQMILDNAKNMDPNIAKLAFIFVLLGYGTKMGLVPMHTWLPDAHSKAPVPVSSLLSGVLLSVAFFLILKFKAVVDIAVGQNFSQSLLIFFGILSIIVSALIILRQKNYKRLLAYSSIEHMGIAALGFGFGGFGQFAALLHIFYHGLAKTILFLSAGNIFLKYGSTKIKNVSGALQALPVTGRLFIVGFLAIVGLPPFGIFFTEFYVFSAGIKAHPVLVCIAIFALILVFAGFLKQISAMILGKKSADIPVGEANAWTYVPIIILVIIFVGLSLFLPDQLKTLINLAVAQ
ncbi:MAG: proton-conducting transporter membrane subunit [Patescibacteria group bacterium]